MNHDVYDIEYALRFVPLFAAKVAVDVGANRGETTKFLLDKGFDVVVIEPNPELRQGLTELSERVKVFTLAASDKEDDMKMQVFKNDGQNSVEPEWAASVFPWDATSETFMVHTRTVSSLLLELGITDVGFVKIDAEGHDAKVLAGLFQGPIRPPVIMFEGNEVLPDSTREALGLMRANGYSKFSAFLRSGTELLHMERFNGEQLPKGWGSCLGTRFYANIIGRRQ